MRQPAVFFLILLLVALPAAAVTYLVPTDAEMIQGSDDVVVARAVSTRVEWKDGRSIVTRSTLRIEEALKGRRAAGDELVLTERGGVIGGRATLIPGTPQYVPGRRYLVFTEANRDGEPVTFGMGLGQFRFVEAEGGPLAVREPMEGFDHNLSPYVERARDANGFAQYVRDVVARRASAEAAYFVDASAMVDGESETSADALTRGSYLLFEDGRPFRWSTATATIVRSAQPVGVDGDAAVALALAQWNGTDSSIDYRDGGRDDTATKGLTEEDGRNAILLNDPNHEVGSGILGIGGVTVGANPYTLDGETFWDMVEVDAVMSRAPSYQSCFNTVVVHEVGHTLGFRHSNQPRKGGDSTTNAIMNAQVACTWNGILKTWDKTAANTVYGSGPVCTAPAITSQPASQTIKGGTELSLSVIAEGTPPLRYRWYEGVPRDTRRPVGESRATLRVPLMPRSASYWVRITNDCGRVDSAAAQITVTPSRRRAVR